MSEKGHRPVVKMKVFTFTDDSEEHELPYPWNPISVETRGSVLQVVAIRRCRQKDDER